MSDFSDNSSELDKYGVWVKKTTTANEEKEVPPVEEPVVDASFIAQSAATDFEIEQDLADSDIHSLAETSVIEEPVIDDTSVEEPGAEETIAEEFPEDNSTTESVPEDFTIESDPDSFNTEDFMEETAPVAEPQGTDETSVSTDELSLDDFSIDSINEDNGPMTFTTDEVEEKASEPESPATEEVSFEDGEINLDAFMNDDTSTPDGEVDLSSFMDDTSAPGGDGEVDLSAFMGDSGSTPDFGNGDIDLEAFMGSEGFASDKQEQEEIEDTDPLDIDLDFEENEDLELQDAEANGDISGIEQTPSFSSMSETTEIEDFDALFDDIVDETPQNQMPTEASKPDLEMTGNTEEIDLSDFGFDDDSDNQNPILGDGSSEPKRKGPVDYEMNVDDEDSPSDTVVAQENKVEEQEENDNSDDIEVDISQDNETSVQKEQETDLSSPDDSFDIDSIFDNIEDESGEIVSFGGNDTPAAPVETTVEKPSAPFEEVTDSKPMFQESQEPDFGETSEKPAIEEPFVIEEPVVEETSVEESVENFEAEETATDEKEIDIPVFDDPTLENAFTETTEITQDEQVFGEPVVEEPVIEETSVEEQTLDSTVSAETPEEASIDLVDFMGEEGFTDGGPGVQGYDTVASESTQETEETEAADTADFKTEEQSFKESAISDSVSEEPNFNSISDFEIEEPMTEAAEETPVETSEEMVYNEKEVTEDSDISLDDFMGEEGFTDGGPGVLGYDSIASSTPQETEEEPEQEETDNVSSDFEESENSDKMEEPALTESDESESMSEITEANEINNEPDYSNISAFADKKPEFDMTGVTLTLDDFENIKEYPETSTEPSVIEEPVIEETSIEESEAIQDQVDTYSVFIKTESSSGKAEVVGTVSEDNDIQRDETVADDATVSAEETMDSFDSSSVLSKISEELASLRTEIKDLKSEFEEIKKNGIQSEDSLYEETDSVADEMPGSVEMPSPDKDTGFFNETDEDDTIALSGDELSNILSTAEFTSKPEESLDEGLKMDFENEELEEPVFNDTEIGLSESEEDEEISVPTVDDVLVESSSTDFMDNTISTADEGNEELSEISDEDIPSPTLESLDLPPYEQEEELTDANIDYLKDDNAELSEEDETLETGISEHPVDTVFNSWDAATEPEEPVIEPPVIEAPVIEEPVIEEPIIEETSVSDMEISAPDVSDSNEIPASMKEEIKSVLSYMDQLLENLPEDKIAEFAQSEQFETYKKLFAELGLS